MKYINREVWAGVAAAACAFLIVACGDLGGTNDGGPTGGCSVDGDCGAGKMCHPLLKTCQVSCTAGADCPSSAKTCATFAGSVYSAGGPAAFCQCASDELCGGSQVCQTTTSKICTSKCTADSQCGSGVSCNTTTGKCGAASDGGTGGTPDAGAAACNSANAQPDTCGYGHACNSLNACQNVSEGDCSNVAAAIVKNNHTLWTQASTGPVIFNVVKETTVQGDCANESDGGVPAAFTVSTYAYSTTDFPANKSALPGFSYLLVNGNKTDIPLNLLRPENYTPSGKTMKATFTLCGAVGTNALQAAISFTGGNAFCVNLTK